MNPGESSGPGGDRFLEYALAGIAGGAGAGFLTAYIEALFLLLTVGSFWVDFPFLISALALYGAAGGSGGLACSLLLQPLLFRRHPLRRIRPWIFFFSLLSAVGLAAETLLYLLDIHTFRDYSGAWTAAAYLVLLAGFLAAGCAGMLIAWISRSLFQGERTSRMRNGGIALFALLGIFLLVRILLAWQEESGAGPAAGGKAARPANVILLVVDALRPDHLSAYGYPLPTSPAIDRLAREGILFRDCYATSTWSIPTHASLFTGLYPSSHGCYSLYSSLDPVVPTLAQVLAAQGYRTGSFYDNLLLGPQWGLSRGFQTALGVDNGHKVSLTLLRVWDRLRGDRSMSKNTLAAARKWVEHAGGRNRPFFLFVNLMDAHLPYRPKKPYSDDFLRSLPAGNVNEKSTRIFTTDGIRSKKVADSLFPRLTAADWRWLGRYYDSNIRGIDDRIGLFVRRLKSRGLLANTLVVITADHGELLGENGLGAHFHPSMHRAALHIPLVFWFPERLPAGEVRQPVSQVDLFAAVLRLAGVPEAVPRDAQGEDLLAPMSNRAIVAEFWDEKLGRFNRALVSGDLKLVAYASGRRELHDLKNDPGEEKDLALLRPGLMRELTSRLDEWLRTVPNRKSRAEAGKRKEMEKLLKSLGYI